VETLLWVVGIFFGVWFVAFVVDLIHDGWTNPQVTESDIERIKKDAVEEYKIAALLEELPRRGKAAKDDQSPTD